VAGVGKVGGDWQGTMNNLTVGTPRGAWYETIGGGSGAGPGFAGTSAAQVHMTNTRATDIEELETRFPVRVLRVERRVGSGGGGQRAGGDGLVKEWLFLAPVDVALLAGRRDAGAPGLDGGEAGARGVDERDVGQGWEPAPPRWVAKAGDKLRISTPGGGGCGTRGTA
jgi:5-oxoprolinase (ATP-hydrolysing)